MTGYPLHRENRENGQKNSVRENTGSLEICQNTGNFFPQVVTSLILKVKDILKMSFVFKVCQVSFVSVIVTNHVNWHKENLRSGRKTNRENTGNLKMQFEWVPSYNHP